MDKPKLEYHLLGEETINYGNNKFIEISKKRVRLQDGSTTCFVAIARGNYKNNNKVYDGKTLALPNNEDMATRIIYALKNIYAIEVA